MSEHKWHSVEDSDGLSGDLVDLDEEKSIDGSVLSEDDDFLASDEDEEDSGVAFSDDVEPAQLSRVEALDRLATLAKITLDSILSWSESRRLTFLSVITRLLAGFVSHGLTSQAFLAASSSEWTQHQVSLQLPQHLLLQLQLPPCHTPLPAISRSRLETLLRSLPTPSGSDLPGIVFEKSATRSLIDDLVQSLAQVQMLQRLATALVVSH